MVQVAKAMAATGAVVLNDPALLKKAKDELKARTGPEGYVSPIPPDVMPPLTMSR